MSEYLRVDLHGNHNNVEVKNIRQDDGRDSIGEMVMAAKRRGLIPALTGHNTTAAYREYGETMGKKEVGMGDVRLYGVEFEYSVDAGDFAAARYMSNTVGVGILPGLKRFEMGLDHGSERAKFYSLDQINEERQRLKLLLNGGNLSLKDRRFLSEVLNEPGFFLFYLNAFSASDGKGGDYQETREELLSLPGEEMWLVTRMAQIYLKKHHQENKFQRQKGEILCIMPQEESMTRKMSALVDKWAETNSPKKEPLQMLFDYLRANLTDQEYKSLLFILPHPVPLAFGWGEIVTHIMEGDLTLFAPEIFVPEVAAEIHGIEVLNGATPDVANLLSVRVAENVLLKDKARTGGGDAHHRQWVGSAATLVEVDEVSTDGIIDAVKRGRTLPVSGWGELSNTAIPFLFWALTVPIDGKTFAPEWFYRLVGNMINIEKPMQKAIEQESMHRPRTSPWVY